MIKTAPRISTFNSPNVPYTYSQRNTLNYFVGYFYNLCAYLFSGKWSVLAIYTLGIFSHWKRVGSGNILWAVNIMGWKENIEDHKRN